MVGISGAAGERWALVTPSARSLPSRTSARLDGMLSNIMVTRPPSTSGIAVARPLPRHMNHVDAGHRLEQFAGDVDRSAEPDDAKVIFPFLPRAMKSLRIFRRHVVVDHQHVGVVASSVIGAKVLHRVITASLSSAGLIECVPTVPTTTGVAISRRFGDEICSRITTGAGFVVHHHRLPQLADIFSEGMRARMSGAPPVVKVTTMRKGLSGKLLAGACAATGAMDTAAPKTADKSRPNAGAAKRSED